MCAYIFFNHINFRSETNVAFDRKDQEENVFDSRLQRLRDYSNKGTIEEKKIRHVHSPKRMNSTTSNSSDDELDMIDDDTENDNEKTRKFSVCSESDFDSDLSDSENCRRRQKLKEKILGRQQEKDLLNKEEERLTESSNDDSSEYEAETESDDNLTPRIKPQFVQKNDRLTIIEKEKDLIKQKQFLEFEAKRQAKERRRNTLKLVEESIKKDLESQKKEKDPHINDVKTDEENDELDYEAWKLRELKRVKREKDDREQISKEKDEIDRIRNMTEEERRKEFQINPKEITNKSNKGKYKFLQKYYHRGAFYLDKDEKVLKQDFSEPTLEDHFDKTVLPKVMQVKNFGRCGRTKYTHLIDQDTTKFDSPWSTEMPSVNSNLVKTKQMFDRPSYLKRNRRNI